MTITAHHIIGTMKQNRKRVEESNDSKEILSEESESSCDDIDTQDTCNTCSKRANSKRDSKHRRKKKSWRLFQFNGYDKCLLNIKILYGIILLLVLLIVISVVELRREINRLEEICEAANQEEPQLFDQELETLFISFTKSQNRRKRGLMEGHDRRNRPKRQRQVIIINNALVRVSSHIVSYCTSNELSSIAI